MFTAKLVDNLLAGDLAKLVKNEFASKVLIELVEHGEVHQIAMVLSALHKDLPNYAKNKYASYVVEKAVRISLDAGGKDAGLTKAWTNMVNTLWRPLDAAPPAADGADDRDGGRRPFLADLAIDPIGHYIVEGL